MRKSALIIPCLFLVVLSLAKTVPMEEARIVADNCFSHYSGKLNPTLSDSFSVNYNGFIVYHVFNYAGGGFVAVAADDAVIPVLAQSDEGCLERDITNPSAEQWFEDYSKEIVFIITEGLDNAETLVQWEHFRNKEFNRSTDDVEPLLSTTWDQGQWYNYYCPAASGGPGGHAWAGCVATAMGQIMKYHGFPEQGFLSHSYEHPVYGTLSASFGETIYDWESMGNSANSISYQEIATLLYHAGVSVNMKFGIDGSGAYSEDLPWALATYFNYDPATVSIAYKTDYSDNEWKELIKTDLNASLPVYYGGDNNTAGHAWVCDGWRSGDDMFHMNWGWSGSENGWFAVGALNTFNGSFNNNNMIVKGVRPGNPGLVVRITNLLPGQVIGYGPEVGIDCSVITGTANTINLYLDGGLIYTGSQAGFTYNLATTDHAIGTHIIKVEAANISDTVYHEVIVSNFGWESQASAFTNTGRGIKAIYIVDSLVVWAVVYDGINLNNYIQEFTRTENGGQTWTAGAISGCSGLEPAMIFALDADKAYCPMFRQTGSNPQGIYMTTDGGISWTRQTSASFSDQYSFPNVVHFFNNNEGFCMGDPINGEFEIYTTINGGNTWTQVPADNIADPTPGEFGVTGYYSTVGNKAWFGTNKGRVYRSTDKGMHWDVSTTTLTGRYVDVRFADGLHGLAQEKDLGTGALSETFDGGISWQDVSVTGRIGTWDFCFVPGTDNTWISTEAGTYHGAYYSFDGGHSWSLFAGSETYQFLALDFIDNTKGWAGSFNLSESEGGVFRFMGSFPSGTLLGPVSSLFAVVTGQYVHLEWTAPATGNVLGYNVYRNDTLLNVTPVMNLIYDDVPVPNGRQTYCVTAVYSSGESHTTCTDAVITYAIDENEKTVKIYPNPVAEAIRIESAISFSQVRIFTLQGEEIYFNAIPGNSLEIPAAGIIPGIYFIEISLGNRIIQRKISVM